MNTTKAQKLTRRGIACRGQYRGGQCQGQGAATSAAKVSHRSGVHDRETYCWIRGEGWVRWTEITRSVVVAFDRWVNRKEGRFPMMHGTV